MPKKHEIKVKFNVTIKSAFDLPAEYNGKQVVLQWKRGSKAANKGDTKKVAVRNGMAVFGDAFQIESTIVQNAKGAFESKKIDMMIKEDDKKAKPFGKLQLDLADNAKQGEYLSLTYPLKDPKAKKGSSAAREPTLKVDIKSTWLRYDKKVITPKTSSGKGGLQIEGVEFDLVTADDDGEDSDGATTLGDLSDSEATFSDEDSELSELSSKSEKKKDKKADKKVRESPRGKSSPATADKQFAGTASSKVILDEVDVTSLLGNDAKDLKKRITALEKMNDDKDKTIKKHEKDLADARADLAKEKEENKSQAMELKRIQKELADTKKLVPATPLPKVKGKKVKLEPAEYEQLKNEVVDAKVKLEKAHADLEAKAAELERAKKEASNAKKPAAVAFAAAATNGDSSDTNEWRKAAVSKDEIIQKMKANEEKQNKKLKRNKAQLSEAKEEIRRLQLKVTPGGGSALTTSTDKGSLRGAGAGVDKQSGELEEYMLVEKYVYTANLGFSENDDAESDNEEGGTQIPVAATALFKILIEKRLLERGAGASSLLTHISSALKACMQHSQQDDDMLCGWLSLTLGLMHLILNDKNIGRNFGAYQDPEENGIMVDLSKKPPPEGPERFVYDLAHTSRKLYTFLIAALEERLASLLVPSVLNSPKTLLKAVPMIQLSQMSEDGFKTADDVVAVLDLFMDDMVDHRLFTSVVHQFFIQAFYTMNATLLNALMEGGPDFCTVSNGFQIKFAAAQIVAWTKLNAEHLDVQASSGQFGPIIDAANTLVMDKTIFAEEKNIRDACPHLNPLQIVHILDSFQPDELEKERPSSSSKQVLSRLAARDKNASLQIDAARLLPYPPPGN